MKSSHTLALVLVAGIALTAFAWPKSRPEPRFVLDSATPPRSVPHFEACMLPRLEAIAAVHGITLTALPGGEILALWYGGSREADPDVALFQARYRNGAWEAPQRLLQAPDVMAATHRYTRRVGNPALAWDGQGRLHLFFVTTSIGGWAVSSLNEMISTDLGQSWSAPKRLVTSPVCNFSNLVRFPGILLADGGFLLPIYYELVRKFPELLRFDSAGQLVEKIRMDGKHGSLQPVLIPYSEAEALAYLRNRDLSGKILLQTTADGGQTWTRPAPLEFACPDASVAVARLPDGLMVMAFNPTVLRDELHLAASTDGVHWSELAILDRRTDDGIHDYCYPMILAQGDTFDLIYTWKSLSFKHLRFNAAWVRALLQKGVSLPTSAFPALNPRIVSLGGQVQINERGNFASIPDLLGLGGHCLCWCWLLSHLPFVRAWRGWRRGIALVACAGLVLIPLPTFGSVVLFCRALLNDLSITSMTVLVFGLARNFECPVWNPRIARPWSLMIVLALVPLYAASSGYIPELDLYCLGYSARGLLVACAATATLAWYSGEKPLAIGLLTGIALYGTGALTSPNLWDYLGDPLLALTAVVGLVVGKGSAARAVAGPIAHTATFTQAA